MYSISFYKITFLFILKVSLLLVFLFSFYLTMPKNFTFYYLTITYNKRLTFVFIAKFKIAISYS